MLPDTEVIMAEEKKALRFGATKFNREHNGDIVCKMYGVGDDLTAKPGSWGTVTRLVPQRTSIAVRDHAQYYGFYVGLSRAGAVSAGDSGKTDPLEKAARIRRKAEFWMEGGDAWEMPAGAAASTKGPDAGLTIMAMIELGKARDLDHAERVLAALGDKLGVNRDGVIAKLWAASDIATKVAELKARARVYAVDSDELLDGIEVE